MKQFCGWFYCPQCELWVCPVTTAAQEQPFGYIREKQVCWPCYDSWADAEWGPTTGEFEYREKHKLPKRVRSRIRQNELKEFRRLNRNRREVDTT